MSANNLDRQPEERLLTEIKDLKRQLSELRTLQNQGIDALQIAYTEDKVFHINVTPYTGLIGTFLFTLQYENPQEDDVVFGDVDIAVNKGTDSFNPSNNLSAYYGLLKMEVINDQYLVNAFNIAYGYHPIVKVVRLYTTESSTAADFYIHYRWRYVGVGRTMKTATGDISILP